MAAPLEPARKPRTVVTKRITVAGNLGQACKEFNTGKFFECHETLEEVWQEEQSEARDLYKGLIQVAAAFVHVTRGNFTGANRLFQTALGYLEPYRAEGALGFDVERIWQETKAAHDVLVGLGRSRVRGFDLEQAPRFSFESGLLPAEARRWGAWGFDGAGNPLEMEIDVVI